MQDPRESVEGRSAEPARTSEGKAAEVERLIAPTVADLGFEIVRVQLTGDGGRQTLQIMAERPDGSMGIEDCADLSSSVSAVLDVEDPISGTYSLEVSSPGLDRPLTRLKDYRNWTGFEAKIELTSPQEGRKRFRGLLGGVEGEEILLQESESEALHRFPFSAIARAKLVLTDALIAATAKSDDAPETEI
ncbi:ribosome maturation factor RimP [Aquibaculum sediminis]|uniref:ribosome maturation factor RimP n=1 Tax=Aquibaculum sediminis TaxID=3231907 RepID=UPI0034557740